MDMADRLNLLKSASIFAGMDESLLRDLAKRCRDRPFKAREALFHEGDEDQTALYLIGSGSIDIQCATASGATVKIATRRRGDCVGELSLIDGAPRMADAVTAEPCELLILRRADFLQCVEESPKFSLGVMSCLANRLREAKEQLLDRQELSVLRRVALLLLVAFEEDPGVALKGIDTTQDKLAQGALTTRESVSRSLASLRGIGAVSKRGRIIFIRNIDKLRRICDR